MYVEREILNGLSFHGSRFQHALGGPIPQI